MEDEILKEARLIEDARQAAVFASPLQRRFLLAFVGPAKSLSEAARAQGLKPSLAHYHARRLLAVGLLEQAGLRARAGSPVRLYRAAARAFRVPMALSPRPPASPLWQELQQRFEIAASEGEALFFLGADGQPRMQRVSPPAGRGAEIWRTLKLDEARASAMMEEIGAVIARYAAEPGTRGRPYLIHAAAAPRG